MLNKWENIQKYPPFILGGDVFVARYDRGLLQRPVDYIGRSSGYRIGLAEAMLVKDAHNPLKPITEDAKQMARTIAAGAEQRLYGRTKPTRYDADPSRNRSYRDWVIDGDGLKNYPADTQQRKYALFGRELQFDPATDRYRLAGTSVYISGDECRAVKRLVDITQPPFGGRSAEAALVLRRVARELLAERATAVPWTPIAKPDSAAPAPITPVTQPEITELRNSVISRFMRRCRQTVYYWRLAWRHRQHAFTDPHCPLCRAWSKR